MTFPLNLTIFGVEISSHLVFEMLAFIIGYRYYLNEKKFYHDPVSAENRIWIIIGAAGGAFFFSRIIGFLENPVIIFEGGRKMLVGFQNRTIVGGLLGGLMGVELVKKIIGEKNSSGDLFTFPLLLGIIIGRIGCFLAGLTDNTYGVETSLPWGVDLGDGIKRHPTSLYEVVYLLMLWLMISKVSRNISLTNGGKFKVFMVGYLLFRFVIDFLKPYTIVFFGMTSIQLACLAGLLYYYKVLLTPHSLKLKPLHA